MNVYITYICYNTLLALKSDINKQIDFVCQQNELLSPPTPPPLFWWFMVKNKIKKLFVKFLSKKYMILGFIFQISLCPYLITGIFLVISETQITQQSFFVCASSYNSHFYYPDQLKHFIKGQKQRKIVKLEMEMDLIND